MKKLVNKIKYLRQIGLVPSVVLIARKFFKIESVFFKKNKNLFCGRGVEIAGPSSIFQLNSYCPVYKYAESLDNVNYSSTTRWHGLMGVDHSFIFNKNKEGGRQIINEASQLIDINDASYDFLISNHMLEHSANPIKVLHEWRRVVKPGGALLVVLPHKNKTFDRRRPLTKLSHLIEDYQANIGEDDQTHLNEIVQMYDFSMDYSNPSIEKLLEWMQDNVNKRGAHHHVFDGRLSLDLMDYVGFEILDIEISSPSNIFLYLRNPQKNSNISNLDFMKNPITEL
jgi:SAM-dependent methyltransferase